MLTLVGADQPGIVAKITKSLLTAQCNLGEASMMRLGGNFTVMLMVSIDIPSGNSPNDGADTIRRLMTPCCDELSLHLHIDEIQGHLHDHQIPDVRVIVCGADRAGIVSQVTESLFEAGMHILDLNSDVAGSTENPIYIMQIEGIATQGIDAIELAVQKINDDGIDIKVQSIDTFVG